jgi:hopanoid biosynthesis associated protein HpnK
MKKLIITGDDFGLSPAVNKAVEEANQRGVLTSASLMVGAEGTADAVERAKRLSSLRVGLHLVLVDGSPVLPPETIPNLVDERGRFSSHLFMAGVNFFLRQEVRRQLEAETRAQFEAFQETGLALDHVNAHHHLHLHPTVSDLLLKVGREYGMKAVRLPYEPLIPSWRASGKALLRRLAASLFLLPWVVLLRNRIRRAEVHSNDFLFGMNDSGHIHLDLILRFLKFLPQGVTEIYFHPGDGPNELDALVNPAMREALLSSPIQTSSFSEL